MPGRGLPPERAARFVAWGNAFLAGWTSLDEAAELVQGRDAWHRVDGLRGGDDVSLAVALGRLASGGVTGLRLALPVPGDVSDLPGPLDFNMEALACGEAVIAVGADVGLLPTVVRTGSSGARSGTAPTAVRWRLSTTDPGQPLGSGIAEADRALAQAVREATAALGALDVGASDASTQDELAEIRGRRPLILPSGYPARAGELLDRACTVAALVSLAGEKEGAAVSAGQLSARHQELVGLAAAARRAVVACYNAVLEPSAAGPAEPGDRRR